ncbi:MULTISPECIES: hypothetical protein [unclassified Paenibacillus]|uniref:hypothetical protein n=1 Tax=unclassified Paenibacillus TaxID=185978 RepID=UPI00135C64A0|nr:hypothetical protein [Paenibacillus sp. USDA918EY]
MGRLSISQRLRKASKPELKQKIAVDWSAEWQTEYETHVRNFEKAIRDKDFDLLVRTLGWLKADGKKRFDALPRVLSALAEEHKVELEEDN